MRKQFPLFLLFAVTVILSSCSKDNNEEINATEASLIGTWNLTALETNDGRAVTIIEGESVVSDFTAVGKDFDSVIVFSENPQIVTSEGSYTTVLTTTVMGQTTTQEEPGENFFESDEWRLDGNLLYFRTGEEEIALTIIALSDSEITLRYTIDETIDALGTTISVKATYNMTLSK